MAKKLEYLREKKNGDLILRHVRLSYLFCFEPQKNVDDDGNVTKKYKCTAILDKKKHAAEIERLKELTKAAAKAVFKQNISADRYCLRDGDLTGKEEYEGSYIFVASEREENPPLCLDRDGKRHVKKSDDKLYSGAVGNVMVRLWTQDNKKGGKRVNANFLGVQWIAEGEKFSSVQRASEEDFENEGDGDEDDGFGDDD